MDHIISDGALAEGRGATPKSFAGTWQYPKFVVALAWYSLLRPLIPTKIDLLGSPG